MTHNTPKVVWLAGWASDFSLWSAAIAREFPGQRHSFVSYQDLLTHHRKISAHPEVAGADAIVAWSLGSLVVSLDWLSFPATLPIALLAPVTEFCHPEHGWSGRVVRRMAARVQVETQATLRDFAALMGPLGQASEAEWKDLQSWVQAGSRYHPGLLAEGLDLLATASVPSMLGSSVAAQRLLLCNRNDAICTPAQAGHSAAVLGLAPTWVEGSDHWPLSSLEARRILREFLAKR